MQEALDWTQPGLSSGQMAHGAFVPHPIGPEDFGAELDTGHDRSACEDFQNPEYCCSDAMPHPPHAKIGKRFTISSSFWNRVRNRNRGVAIHS
ncbi:hypothetical protein JHK84_041187 [Glycine max]|nr:hypothetical protein JHK84_041187 [Glycine max]